MTGWKTPTTASAMMIPSVNENKFEAVGEVTKLLFTFSQPTIETPEQCVKSVQS